MKIIDILTQGRPAVSFEFFPPKSDVGFDELFRTIEALRPLDPSYVSVTYGAGGSTRRKTIGRSAAMQRVFYGWWIVAAGGLVQGYAAAVFWRGFAAFFGPKPGTRNKAMTPRGISSSN